MHRSENQRYREALERLTLQGLAEQWSPSAVDWSQPVAVPRGVRPRAYVDMISQLYHFEEASIEVLGRLVEESDDRIIRRYLHTQIADETRHAAVYRAYLGRLGDMAPINEGLRILLDVGLGVERSFRTKIVALNVMMEADAERQQNAQIDRLPCLLLRQISRLVAQDEARHTLFGTLYMSHALVGASDYDKQAILRFGASLWRLWEAAQLERYGKGEAVFFGTRAADFRARWTAVRRRFAEAGLLPTSEAPQAPAMSRVPREVTVAPA
jgi:hypothetical protein